MSMNDPVADMLIRIKNSQLVGEKKIKMYSSKIKLAILKVLKNEGLIEDFNTCAFNNKSQVEISLKYYQGKPVIQNLKRISRPGLRIYKSFNNLPVLQGSLGVVILSTPKGVMTVKAARERKLGGEVLCTVE